VLGGLEQSGIATPRCGRRVRRIRHDRLCVPILILEIAVEKTVNKFTSLGQQKRRYRGRPRQSHRGCSVLRRGILVHLVFAT